MPGSHPHNTVGEGMAHYIEHYIQAGVAVDNDIICRHFDQFSQQMLCFRDAIHNTIVTAINSCLTLQICKAVQYIHHTHGKIQLRCARFTAGHIQFQSFTLELLILSLQLTLFLQ